MDTLNEFDLNTALEKWVKYNCSGEDLTPADVQEMRDHFLNTVNELKEKNLTEEEAFAVAKIRIGGAHDWSDEMKSMNEDNFQLKKVVLLFSGIFMFILCYNLITSVNKLLLLGLNYYNGDVVANIEISKIYFNIIYLVTVLAIVALYYLHKPMVWLLNKMSQNPNWLIQLLVISAIFIVLDRFLVPQLRKSLEHQTFIDTFFLTEKYFEFIFPSIIGIGYYIIYRKYRRNNYTKNP